jgi:hypothetical protein
MKRISGVMVALTVAATLLLGAMAWGQAEKSASKPTPKKDEVKKSEMKAKAGEDKEKSEAYTMMETRLKGLDARIKAAEAKVAKAPAAQKTALEAKLKAVQEKRKAVDGKMKAFKDSAADKWMDARNEARMSIDDTESAFMAMLASDKMFAKEEKEEYEAQAMNQMKMADAKLKALEDKAAKATGDAKKDADKLVTDAKAKRTEAETKLKKVKEAKDADWKNFKADADKALKDLSDILK